MNVTFPKIKQYFVDNGAAAHQAEKYVELMKLPSEGMEIISWSDQAPVERPLDSYWDLAEEYVDVPVEVTARQFRLALIEDGVSMANVDAVIDSLPDDGTRDKARVEWEYAGGIQRTNATMLALAPALGYDTEEKIDDLFRSAKGR
jgi:hypothetical protein